MRTLAASGQITTPAVTRLAALAPLDATTLAALEQAVASSTRVSTRAELAHEGRPITGTRLIVRGWAARVRLLADGRRQFLSFLLPGDMIGLCRQPRPLAVSSVVALTDLLVCTPPPPETSPALSAAYWLSMALEEAYLLAHITRLGRLHAPERIADLLLELHERLSLAGMTIGGQFEVPLTQEMLGDALGLTAVHVNRMLMAARRNGDLEWREKRVVLRDPKALARKVGRAPVQVSELHP